MRLTLRTLLAYRDGVLSPADSEDLHRRIQQSEDAGNLLRRIHAVTKHVQRASPMIVGRGLGGDPNFLAEYLDDVLLSERVPELERICLESDIRLSELATCHTLLSSAMHTQVAVPNGLRELAIRIGSMDQRDEIREFLKSRKHQRNGSESILRADAPHGLEVAGATSLTDSTGETQAPDSEVVEGGDQAVQVQAPMVASGGESIKEQGLNLEGSTLAHEVPEYLVGRNSGSWRIPLAIGGLLALLGVMVWQTLGPVDGILEMLSSRPIEQPEAEITGGSSSATDRGEAGELPTASVDPTTPDETSRDVSSSEKVAGLDRESASEIRESNEAPPISEGQGTSPAANPAPADPATSSHGKTLEPESSSKPPGLGAWVPKDDLEKQAVLLILNQEKLRSLRAGDQLSGPGKLVVPPNYRTTLDMPGGVLWTTCGPSLLEISHVDGPRVQSSLCRALIRQGPDGNEIEIGTVVGDFQIQLLDGTSMASIEFEYRQKRHGSLLESGVFEPTFVVVAVEGDVLVTLDGDEFRLGLGEGLAKVGEDRPKSFKLQSIPNWYGKQAERPIDGLAAKDIVRAFAADKDGKLPDAGNVLRDLIRSPKPETAAMAIQTALLCGNLQPFSLGFLENPRFSSHWKNTLALVTQVLCAEPENATTVRAALSSRSPKGDSQFQMLVGLTKGDLADEGLAQLIAQLDDTDLISRVLAIYQLERLTGKVLAYQAYAPNRASIQQWRRELATNRLEVGSLRDPIRERISR